MKKLYTKPEIMFESFALSAHIAACKNEANFQDEGCAAYYAPDFEAYVFTSSTTGCEWVEQDGDFNGICYDLPVDGLGYFGS